MEIIICKNSNPNNNNNNASYQTSNILFQNTDNCCRMDIQAIIFARDIVLSACKYLIIASSSSSSKNNNIYKSALYHIVSYLFPSTSFVITPIIQNNSEVGGGTRNNNKLKIVDISITTPTSYNKNNNDSLLSFNKKYSQVDNQSLENTTQKYNQPASS